MPPLENRNRRHALLFILAAFIAWSLAVRTGDRLLYQVAYVISGAFIMALALAWLQVRWLTLTRRPRTRRIQVGHMFEEQVTLRNRSLLPKWWVEVHDASTLPLHRVSRIVMGLRPRAAFRWYVRTLVLMRGVYRLGPVRLVSSDPFGLFTFVRDIPEHMSVVVYPLTLPLPFFPLPEGRLPGGTRIHRRTHYLTTNVAGVREYQPGDTWSRIHWPTTARVGRLMSKEFELDPYADVWCVLDMYEEVYTGTLWTEEMLITTPGVLRLGRKRTLLPPHSAEYAIAAAASVGDYVLRHQRLLGFVTYDTKRLVIYPDRGEKHRHRFLETLALLHVGGRIPLARVLSMEMNLFPRNSTLVVITGDWTPRWVLALREIRRRGIHPIAIVVDNSTFGPLPAPEEVIHHLAQAHIPAYVLRRDDDVRQVLGRGAFPAYSPLVTRSMGT